ncbi:MAG: hypothetical protein K0B06_03640 [Brevefilum sp.]|nr:hypothetical protein [Brevefilum sp.]
MDSEKIKGWLKDFRITLPVGVVVGLILGLVIGWGIWPVQWTDLAPYHLRPDLREDYLRMSIFTSTNVGNAAIAEKAWSELEATAEETLLVVRNQPRYLSDAQITSFMLLVGAEMDQVASPEVVAEEPEIEEPTEGSGINWGLVIGLLIVVLVAVVAVFYFFVLHGKLPDFKRPEILNKRKMPVDEVDFDEDANRYIPPAQVSYEPSYPEEPSALPVAQFMTTYALGDDLYDDSFSIDAPTGEFLGECGVGISETVGVGDPKRVTAFEVWLFDKNDIQTVTKVIMSEHAHEDDKLRIRLESKGELVLAEPGKQILLETATLQLEARIIDMAYGEGPAPELSFFERLTLELAIWPK